MGLGLHTEREEREKENRTTEKPTHWHPASLPPGTRPEVEVTGWPLTALTLGMQGVRLRRQEACWWVTGRRRLPNRTFVFQLCGKTAENVRKYSPLSFSKQCWAQIVFSPLATLPKLLERVVLPPGKPPALAVPSAGHRAPLIWEDRDTFSRESCRMSGHSAERLGEGLALTCLPGTGEEELQQKVWKANWLRPLGTITKARHVNGPCLLPSKSNDMVSSNTPKPIRGHCYRPWGINGFTQPSSNEGSNTRRERKGPIPQLYYTLPHPI